MAALKARHLVLGAVHNWFRKNGFIEITAPILTPVLLYDEDTGIRANVNGTGTLKQKWHFAHLMNSSL